MNCTIKFMVMLIVVFPVSLFGQGGTTAVPFLLIGTSLSGNGMGEIRASSNTGSALMATYNPGLLGVQRFHSRFDSEIFTRRVGWLPSFRGANLSITSNAFITGLTLDEGDGMPVPLAFGIGYSNFYLNLGEYILTSSTSPDTIGKYHAYERVDALSFGAAIRYGITLGAGFNIKRIHSQLGPNGTAQEPGYGSATPIAYDFGTFVDIPILTPPVSTFHSPHGVLLHPMLSLSLAYIYGNIGGDVSYDAVPQSDPLPREITAGYTLTGGYQLDFRGSRIPLVELTFVREAHDLAVVKTGDQWSYQYGLGNININDNLIRGIASARSTLRKGGSISLFGLVTFREGSNMMDSRDHFTCEGTELHLFGLFRFLTPFLPSISDHPVLGFFFTRLELTYIQSRYSGSSLLHSTSFEGITLGFR